MLKRNTQQWHEIQDCVNTLFDHSKDTEYKKRSFDLLMIKIRPYVNKGILRDILHLCAHPIRDKGLGIDHLSKFDRYLRFHLKYGNSKETLDLKNLPLYIKDYLEDQLEAAQDKKLKKALNLNKRDVRNKISKHIKCNENTCYLDKEDAEMINVIIFLTKEFRLSALYDSKIVLSELKLYLERNGFCKEGNFYKITDELNIFLILTLHDKSYSLNTAEAHSFIRSHYNLDTRKFNVTVQLLIQYDEELTGNPIRISIPMLQTDLISSELFDETLATTGRTGNDEHPDYRSCQPLKINNAYKLLAYDLSHSYDMSYHATVRINPKHGSAKGDGSIGYNK